MPNIRTWLALLFADSRMSNVTTAINLRFDRMPQNAAESLLPLGFARHSWPDGGISRVGLGDHKRIHASRVASFSFFARPEGCGTRDACCARIARLDLRLVLAHRHRCQRYFLLCDFRCARLSR